MSQKSCKMVTIASGVIGIAYRLEEIRLRD